MKALNVVTPVPPQPTGIADYADGLIRGLRSLGHDINIFTQSRFCHTPSPLGRVMGLDAYDPVENDPSRTIYQIGNNRAFHDEQILSFFKYGGVVHLHDFSLHHLFAHFTYGKDSEIYYALLRKWYGEAFSDSCRQRIDSGEILPWESSDVLRHPLNEEVIARASKVIVHSHLARNFILERFSETPTFLIPQCYPDGVPVKRHKVLDSLNVCTLGFVDRFKRVDKQIEAIALCKERGLEIRLDVVGRLSEDCSDLPDMAADLGVSHLVQFKGSVSQDELLNYFRSADVCIVLRDPTVGETSAIVSRALQYGLPLIVSDIGTYSETPDFVGKVSVGQNAAAELGFILEEWATKPQVYDDISARSYRYANSDLASFSRTCEAYSALF
ncbi:glycosyltransferase [Agrobacterium tumefaciens]|uniref:glycosyltransferase family 4 protein n=1 Tax=Agrobacterium tumefaciens TaxID=358 RepID=UPI000EF357BB|nr:hypothetical protein At1D1108_42910 [Agrobacterium tumefaciens]NSY93056.1 glycosyltransferase [Agrobacterium tumefaciens]